MPRRLPLLLLLLMLAVLAARDGLDPAPHPHTAMQPPSTPDQPLDTAMAVLPGMPLADPQNVYAAAGAGMLSAVVRDDRPLVYVPNTNSGDVWVIDPATF